MRNNEKKEPSTITMIIKGFIMVNIPITIIILIIWYVLWYFYNLNYYMSVILGVAAGWYYWSFSIKKWILWATENNVEQERILKVGRIGLLLWRKQTIINALKKE